MSATTYGRPLIVVGFNDTSSATVLTKCRLGENGTYNERWLQHLIVRHPNLLPVEDLEPALTPLIPICMELPVPSGYVDNIYVTPMGDIIVVETKLWRNPEARREVIGQILDYAKDLSAWDYEHFNAAVQKAESPAVANEGNGKGSSIYQTVLASGSGEIDESQFIDSVSRNLRLGRFLLLIVGDGIQEGAESIASFLQQHAGMHFTLGLVELAIFSLPNDGGYLVQPRTLMRTTNIDRGIVTIHDGRVTVQAPTISERGMKSASGGKRTSISEERFYEELGANHPDVPAKLKKLLENLAPLGVTTDFGSKSMILRWRPDETRAWNLASIITDGKVWTDVIHAQTDSVGLLDLSHRYVKEIASKIPGAYVKDTSPVAWHVDKDGTYIRINEILAHPDEFVAAIRSFTSKAAEALKE